MYRQGLFVRAHLFVYSPNQKLYVWLNQKHSGIAFREAFANNTDELKNVFRVHSSRVFNHKAFIFFRRAHLADIESPELAPHRSAFQSTLPLGTSEFFINPARELHRQARLIQ